ncbi:hypothetical protein KIW84_013894 [Lathyrus oleraceus]|uniref:Uncharacterized protein n=1 Tax=Pisum sativum TaxID=3888 RepID=A0A9D5BLV6_PEA|nr:hypothetical protein KIW84_013893 [Pisum sativum]KAI5445828.1 hypothetical protein KIW84_013894 [Pisum sativum]
MAEAFPHPHLLNSGSPTPSLSSTATGVSPTSPPSPLHTPADINSPHTPIPSTSSSPGLILSDIAKCSTISPSSSPAESSVSHVPLPFNPSQPFIHPLNTHIMQTRAKSGVTQPRLTPTLLLTHMEPSSVSQALAVPHWSVVGALQYATLTRPEISFSVNKVCQFLSNPLEEHWRAVKRILRYLCGTLQHGLLLQPAQTQQPLSLLGFCDADWASDPDDRRSTSDVFTKPLSAVKFLPLRDKLRVVNKQSLSDTPSTSKGE